MKKINHFLPVFLCITALLASAQYTHCMVSASATGQVIYLFSYLFCCCSCPKKSSKPIKLTKDEIKKLKVVAITYDYMTTINLMHNGLCVGSAKYYNIAFSNYGSDDSEEFIEINTIEVKKEHQGCGLGTKLFQETLRNIRKNHPSAAYVQWDIHPLDLLSSDKRFAPAREKLHEFYIKLGATTDKEKHRGYIYLKDVEYLKNNEKEE